MITGVHIHNWLQNPQTMEPQNALAMQDMLAEWPFFAPAALLVHYHQKGNVRSLNLEEMYNFNPVVYHYWDKEEQWIAVETDKKSNVQDVKPMNIRKHADWDMMDEVLLEHEKEHTNEDYFRLQGIDVSSALPEKETIDLTDKISKEQALMVVMSFTEWLQFLQKKTKLELEEESEKRALRAQWQKQKMAEAIEEENDEIPETVFEMAVNSISREDGIVSESMAVVYEKQGKIAEAINIYKKLSLNNPEKSIYFAGKIENLQKEI